MTSVGDGAPPARYPAVVALVVLTCLVLAACGSGRPGAAASAPAGGRHTVTVLAAASLTEAFTAIAKDAEAAHPGLDVRLSFAASSTIVAQVNEGAPADVIALAGQEALKPLQPGHVVPHGTTVFTTNRLEVATPPADPGHVERLADLARPGLKVVLCAPQVPCGNAARTALAEAGVRAHVVSYERDVKAALAKVELGEADAAIVYHSDVVSAGDRVRGVPIGADVNQVLRYPICRLDDSAGARQLVAAVLSAKGQAALRENGFGTR